MNLCNGNHVLGSDLFYNQDRWLGKCIKCNLILSVENSDLSSIGTKSHECALNCLAVVIESARQIAQCECNPSLSLDDFILLVRDIWGR